MKKSPSTSKIVLSIVALAAVAVLIVVIILKDGDTAVKKHLQADLENFLDTEIQIPELSRAMLNGRDTLLEINHSPAARMIIFYDSTVCGSCKILQIRHWQPLVDLAKFTENKFEPLFIFAPSGKDEVDVKKALIVYTFEWPVFIDRSQKLIASNPELPKNKLLHTFLLDKDNRVVLAGEPMANPELWGLYVSAIRELIADAGVLE